MNNHGGIMYIIAAGEWGWTIMGVEDKPNARGIEVLFRFECVPRWGIATRGFYDYGRMCKLVSVFIVAHRISISSINTRRLPIAVFQRIDSKSSN